MKKWKIYVWQVTVKLAALQAEKLRWRQKKSYPP